MFTRHTLFRQFAVLADTSFNYVKVKPLIVQSKLNLTGVISSSTGEHGSSLDNKYVDIVNDQLSYAPSGREKRKGKEKKNKENQFSHTSKPETIF
uniref:DUF4724 domain-containing protein n=1 Tax=Otolemur garnettii TaxID=30611 RepID=H0X039_OTOGA